MIDPTVLGADIAAGAAVLVAGITAVTTWLNWRGQRNDANQQRRHERSMRLLDSTLTAAVEFLAAADRTARAQQGLSAAYISLDSAKSGSDEQVYQHYLAIVEESREAARGAAADAENAYSAIRMLSPDVADPAHRYLDFCLRANIHPDETKVDRERARQMTEQAIRTALDEDSPAARALAQASRSRRRMALRRTPPANGGAPRQP